jgi:hypothetical protein
MKPHPNSHSGQLVNGIRTNDFLLYGILEVELSYELHTLSIGSMKCNIKGAHRTPIYKFFNN